MVLGREMSKEFGKYKVQYNFLIIKEYFAALV